MIGFARHEGRPVNVRDNRRTPKVGNNIRVYTVAGVHWLGLETQSGVIVLITRLGLVGHCIRMG